MVARAKGDAAAARDPFTRARAELEEALRKRPDKADLLGSLGVIDAGLGRKEEALREGRRVMDLVPIAKNPLDGLSTLHSFAWICAWSGERELAIEQLDILAKLPGGITYGQLHLSPAWDSLRGDPRFEKIVASLAPK